MHTNDALFDGRLLLRQPRRGYRFSADAPLLVWFASTAAEGRFRNAVDLGSGCGVVALGLLVAEKAERVVAVELQPRLAQLGETNAALNDLRDRYTQVCSDIRSFSRNGEKFDLVVVNPPFWKAGEGRAPEDPERRIACHETEIDLGGWVDAAARLVEPKRGRVCAIFPARRWPELLSACEKCSLGTVRATAIHPRPGARAELVLVEARLGGPQPLALEPPLFLRGDDGSDSTAAQSIFSGAFCEAIASRRDRRDVFNNE